MNIEGLVEKYTNNPVKTRRVKYYEDCNNNMVAKNCSTCGVVKELSDFSKSKGMLGNRRNICKECDSVRRKEYYENNVERELSTDRKWRESNVEKDAARRKTWDVKNPEKALIKQHVRRARKKVLPNDLTSEQYQQTLNHFNYACALTGCTERIETEHALPLAIGHGGTTFGNCYPMSVKLNRSKGTRNIFEWFEENKQRFEIEQWRFDILIEWLSNANGITVEEYRAYVFKCHANPQNDNNEAI